MASSVCTRSRSSLFSFTPGGAKRNAVSHGKFGRIISYSSPSSSRAGARYQSSSLSRSSSVVVTRCCWPLSSSSSTRSRCNNEISLKAFQWTPTHHSMIPQLLSHHQPVGTTTTTRYYQTTQNVLIQTGKKQPQSLPKVDAVNHQPPFPIRVALVSATTALATPIFPAIGLVNLFLRVVLPEPNLRATISTSIGTVLSFATWTVVPAMYSVAPIILPCAIGNGAVAGMTYAMIDITSGGPQSWMLRRNPLTSGAIGAVTGFVAPYFCYGPICSVLYGMEGITESTRLLLAIPLATQVTMATGFVAGLSMYPLLYFPMYGIRGVHWMNFSGTALLAMALALCYVYTPDESMILPEGSYVEPETIPLLDSIARYNITTGAIEAYSISSGKWIGPIELRDEGRQLASILRKNTDPAFDDRIVAWLDSYTFMDVASKYPERIVKVQDEKSLQKKEEAMLVTDGVVAFVLARSKARKSKDRSSNDNNRLISTTRERLLEVVETMTPTRRFRNNSTRVQNTVVLMETLSIAVELMLLLQQQHDCDDDNDHKNKDLQLGYDLRKDVIEDFIQQSNLDVVVFTEDEKVAGESIESQLRHQAWNGGDTSDVKVVMEEWKRISDLLAAEEEEQRRWRDRVVQVGAVLLSLGGMLLLNHQG